MALVTAYVPKFVRKSEVRNLRKLGFTVTDTAITGGTDNLMARRLMGGKRRVTQLKRLGIR
jgi:hypothetical protein